MERKADISAEAEAVISGLRAAGMQIPTLDKLAQYRNETRAGYAPYVEQALAGFDGEIKDIEIAGFINAHL
jgi:hypothetical protein